MQVAVSFGLLAPVVLANPIARELEQLLIQKGIYCIALDGDTEDLGSI